MKDNTRFYRSASQKNKISVSVSTDINIFYQEATLEEEEALATSATTVPLYLRVRWSSLSGSGRAATGQAPPQQ